VVYQCHDQEDGPMNAKNLRVQGITELMSVVEGEAH
jgi:hypothetical protein